MHAQQKNDNNEKTPTTRSDGTKPSSENAATKIGLLITSWADLKDWPMWIWGRYLLINHTVKNFKVDGRVITTMEMAAIISWYQKLRELRNDSFDHRTEAGHDQTAATQNVGVWQIRSR